MIDDDCPHLMLPIQQHGNKEKKLRRTREFLPERFARKEADLQLRSINADLNI